MNIQLILDVLIHVLILFTFLCVFFFTFISKIEQKAFQDELGNMIEKNVTTLIDDNKNNVLPYINRAKPYLENLEQVYNTPNKTVVETNKTIKMCCIFVVIALVLVIATILVFANNRKFNMKHILLENIVTFIFIGIIEFWFFTNIAIKWVPTTPSLMVNSLYKSVGSNLS